jgi:hypothetical protein
MSYDAVVYLGDCAALSFLQNIQELIQNEQELADVAKDLSSLSVLEEAESRESESVLAYNNANLGDLEALVKTFFTAVRILSFLALSTLHELFECKTLDAANKETGLRHVAS